VAEYWIIDPDAATVEVFALIKGVYQLHSKATGKVPAKSKMLAGFNITFNELTA
jgi:Uma2 family endonuclease